MTRIPYEEALRRTDLLTILAEYDPHAVGTPPLGIDLPDSDIDIICQAQDAPRFSATLTSHFSRMPDFTIHARPDLVATVSRFTAHGWLFEIFGQACPVVRQHGWRHFQVERRLLALGGPAFRRAVMKLRRQGMKTEPAFAALLGLPGDPYKALLALEAEDDAELRARLLPRA